MISFIYVFILVLGFVFLKGLDYDCFNLIGEFVNCLEFVSGDGKVLLLKECCMVIGSV